MEVATYRRHRDGLSRSTHRAYRIAVIPGDGIGKEVVPEGLRVLEAASAKYGFALRFDQYDFSSANINAEGRFPSLFEPVHGSAPDIAGQGIANPVGQIWAAAMMLDHLGEAEASAAIIRAIESVLASPALRTRDLGGHADTVTAGKAIANALS
jgi:isocitrate/isopropylmalate dehydrogenase